MNKYWHWGLYKKIHGLLLACVSVVFCVQAEERSAAGPIMLVVGTRPEAIKLLPLYTMLKKEGANVRLCTTFQHSDLLEQAFDIFGVVPDDNLNVMKPNQDLSWLTATILEEMSTLFVEHKPSLVVVHGDTTTTMASALAAFYQQIPIAHVEAGLRTGDIHAPFPEELNRKIVGQIATYHFTPTALATANMLREGARYDQVICTGNTVVDALRAIVSQFKSGVLMPTASLKEKIEQCKEAGRKVVLLTAHRRESFGGGFERIFSAIKTFAQAHEDVEFLFPMHPNPKLRAVVEGAGLHQVPNISLIEPLSYPDLVYVLSASDWVVTDSGGIQEEALSLGRRVVCLRDTTERWEGVWEGSEILVGTDEALITDAMERYNNLDDPHVEQSNVFGDGHACERIVAAIKQFLHKSMGPASE